MRWIDEGFRQAPGQYILQMLMAFATMVALVIGLGALTNGTVVAALGASAFIVFAMPKHTTAQPRRLIGGHVMCIAIGMLCSVPLTMGWIGSGVGQGIVGAVSVSLAIFAMVVFNTEHPPAAGNALAFACYVSCRRAARSSSTRRSRLLNLTRNRRDSCRMR